MRTLLTVLILVGLSGIATAGAPAEGGGNDEGKAKTDPKQGLVAHYFKDPVEWDGKWKEGEKTTADPKEFTFREYRYSRIEPLVNHLFIRRGWFSVRWVGRVKIEPGLGVLKKETGGKPDDAPPAALPEAPVDVTFELWMDDGARLFIDGEKLVDDWRPCPEDSPESHRKVTVQLTPGPHRIVIEYFQGESMKHDDRDPAKLYWSSEPQGVKRHIVPASHFFYTDEDLLDYEPSTAPAEKPEGEAEKLPVLLPAREDGKGGNAHQPPGEGTPAGTE